MGSMLRGREDVPTDLPSTRASCLLRTLVCHASTLRQVFHGSSLGSTGLGSLFAPNVGNILRAKKKMTLQPNVAKSGRAAGQRGKTSALPPFQKPLTRNRAAAATCGRGRCDFPAILRLTPKIASG